MCTACFVVLTSLHIFIAAVCIAFSHEENTTKLDPFRTFCANFLHIHYIHLQHVWKLPPKVLNCFWRSHLLVFKKKGGKEKCYYPFCHSSLHPVFAIFPRLLPLIAAHFHAVKSWASMKHVRAFHTLKKGKKRWSLLFGTKACMKALGHCRGREREVGGDQKDGTHWTKGSRQRWIGRKRKKKRSRVLF